MIWLHEVFTKINMAAVEDKSQAESTCLEENLSKKMLRKLQVFFITTPSSSNLDDFFYLAQISFQSEVCEKLKCNVCPKYRCTSLRMYEEHLKSKKHLRRKFRKESESVWYCEACKLKLPNDTEWVKVFKICSCLLKN